MTGRTFRRGDPVVYRTWQFDRDTSTWSQINREANVAGLPGDRFRWLPRPGHVVVGWVPVGHVRLITPHDGGKRLTLPETEVHPR